MAEHGGNGRINRMYGWYPFKKSERDIIADLCSASDELYGSGKLVLSGDETEAVMAFGGDFLSDDAYCLDEEDAWAPADPEGFYIETKRQEYREAFWDYMSENGEDW